MPTLQIRLDAETFEQVKLRGGSPWARDVLVDSLTARPVGESEQLLPATETDGYCPRWVHHFVGVKCSTCGETP